jgi:hypothetical protein
VTCDEVLHHFLCVSEKCSRLVEREKTINPPSLTRLHSSRNEENSLSTCEHMRHLVCAPAEGFLEPRLVMAIVLGERLIRSTALSFSPGW